MMLFEKNSSDEITDSVSPQRSTHFKDLSQTYVMEGRTVDRRVATYHLILAPTHACNLRCEHCYLPDHAAQSMSKEVALRLIHEWNEIAVSETPTRRAIFHVKGGEPLVYKPLIAMMETIQRLPHLHFMMTTNGTLFESRHWKTLSRLNESSQGNTTIVISLDGATEETHELLRGTGTFERTVSTIRELKRRQIRTYINSVIHAKNIHELDDLISFALSHDVAQLNFLPFVPKGYGEHIRKYQLPHKEIHDRMKKVYDALAPEGRSLLAGSVADIIAKERSGYFQASRECVAGYRGLLYVKPNGDAFTCPNLEQKEYAVGNVNSRDVKSILDGLSDLYCSLHADKKSDRMICMGERKLYEKIRDGSNLAHLQDIQTISAQENRPDAPMHSFCVSRNW